MDTNQNNRNKPDYQSLTTYLNKFVPKTKLMHGGTFNEDKTTFYFTLSSTTFSSFNVWTTHWSPEGWTTPALAFFNSDYNEHGTFISPKDGSIYFSSTRPIGKDNYAATWHIWRVDPKERPEPVPLLLEGMEDRLYSHPSISAKGTLFFHAANPDYSDMAIYYCQPLATGEWTKPTRLTLGQESKVLGQCTPYIDQKENFLLYASILSNGSLEMQQVPLTDTFGLASAAISLEQWTGTATQGNPYYLASDSLLIFASGSFSAKGQPENWKLKCVPFQSKY